MKTASRELIDSLIASCRLPNRMQGEVGKPTVLIIDKQHRIELDEGAQGMAFMRARVMDLPAAGMRRDTVLIEIGRLAVVPALHHGIGCVVDPRESAVWLQRACAPGIGAVDFSRQVGQFVDVLATFKKAIERMHF